MWDVKMMVDIVGGQEAIIKSNKMKNKETYDGDCGAFMLTPTLLRFYKRDLTIFFFDDIV
jgi:hypothetical protein